jgi:hypothetical protein
VAVAEPEPEPEPERALARVRRAEAAPAQGRQAAAVQLLQARLPVRGLRVRPAVG